MSRLNLFASFALGLSLVAVCRSVEASHFPCADGRESDVRPSATTALNVLRAAVGIRGVCGPCFCDVNADELVTSTDALLTIRRSVGLEDTLSCNGCVCASLSDTRPDRFDVGLSPRSVSVADIDGDGVREILAANTMSDDVVVWSVSNDTSYPSSRHWVGRTPLSLTFADLNHDGVRDFVTTNALPGNLTVVFGQPDGSFGGFDSKLTIDAGLAPINAEAADMDRDGFVDLIVANSLSDDVSLLLGNGDGTFKTYDRIPVGNGPRWAAVSDVNHDGFQDVVTANRDSNDLTVLLGGRHGRLRHHSTIPAPDGPYQVRLADMDGDRRSDIVVPSYYDESVSILRGRGDGHFDLTSTSKTEGRAIAAEVADLNGDAVLDLVVANLDTKMAVFLGNGDGGLGAPTLYAALRSPRALAVDDMDGDGMMDIVVAGSKSNQVYIMRAIGDGKFGPGVISPGGRYARDLTAIDLNGDGLRDIVFVGDRNWISSHINDGKGGFTPGTEVHTIRPPTQVFGSDLNKDGIEDLVLLTRARSYCTFVASHYDFHAQAPRREGVSTMLGNGDGSFQPERIVDDLITRHAAVADFDGDGTPDLVAGYRTRLLSGLGDGTFETKGRLPVEEDDWICTPFHWTRDKSAELACVSESRSAVRLFDVEADGAFVPLVERQISGVPHHIETADFDGDDRVDLLVLTEEGTVTVWPARGRAGLAKRRRSAFADNIRHLRVSDIDGDGAADLVAQRHGVTVVSRGRGDATFRERGHLPRFSPGAFRTEYISAYALDDFDNDGQIDFVGANQLGAYAQLLTLETIAACLPHNESGI